MKDEINEDQNFIWILEFNFRFSMQNALMIISSFYSRFL